MKRRLLALALACVMVLSFAACGGGSGSGDSGSKDEDGVTISIFNSKSEIQNQFEELVETYSEKHKGVNIEVFYSNDTIPAHFATKYASNDPYTISMVDPKDVYSFGAEHALDLSDQDWVSHTNYAISVDGKVVGFPVCIEARGLMYNKDAIKEITGKDFDPASVQTLDDFRACLETLKKGGMDDPVGIMKEDWSLAAHYFQEIYEMQPDPEAFVQSLYAGQADLGNNEKFRSMMDTFDVLKEYNYAKSSPLAAEREVSEQKLAKGDIAFMFGGNWDWSLIKDYNAEANLGLMPVPQNTADGTNTRLVGGSTKYFFIDSSDSFSEEQIAAARDFLNWLVSDPEGNAFLTEKCAIVPAFDNIDASALDPLSVSVKEFADAGAIIDNYNYDPDDHISVVGDSMQRYFADEIDRAKLSKEVEKYWSNAEPVAH